MSSSGALALTPGEGRTLAARLSAQALDRAEAPTGASSLETGTLDREEEPRLAAVVDLPNRKPAGGLELYPGILEAVRIALGNWRARKRLAAARELADRGRETGARV